MKVRMIMSQPVTVTADTPIFYAAQLMEEHRIGTVVVVDEYEKAIGILTDRDIVCRGVAYDVPLDDPVSEIMSKRLYVIYDDDDVNVAAFFMGAKQVRRLIVLDRYQNLVGILSIGDIAKTEYYEHSIGETMTRISYPYSDWMNHPHYGVEVDDFRL